MEKPKAVHARDIVEGMPYIGETYQPDDRVYRKDEMDSYLEYLAKEIKRVIEEGWR